MNLTAPPHKRSAGQPTNAEMIALASALAMVGLGLAIINNYWLVPAVLIGFLVVALVSIVSSIIALSRQPVGRGTNVFRIMDILILVLGIPMLLILLYFVYIAAATL